MKIILPLVFGFCILWWMYRGIDWQAFVRCVTHDMNWNWMLLSLAFGIVPQVLRALRWRMALHPLGEHASRRVCVDAIFLSYASSLVIPRVGEVARCGTLKTYEGISFSRSLGTVVTERVVDSLLMLALTGVAFMSQLPQFLRFVQATGMNYHTILSRFTSAGYMVTASCIVIALAFILTLLWRLAIFRKGKDFVRSLLEGVASLRKVDNLPLYTLYSLGIWVGYFLHFYIAFFCFEATAGVSPMAAFLIFCVGSFAVLVPTPNGAGPWHFAIKTMLVLYGVAETPAIMFALVVHAIQTALVVLLGMYGWADLSLTARVRRAPQRETVAP